MTKILIDEEVVKQALETLMRFEGEYGWDNTCDNAVTALRSALDATEKVEPVAWINSFGDVSFDAAYGKRNNLEPLYSLGEAK